MVKEIPQICFSSKLIVQFVNLHATFPVASRRNYRGSIQGQGHEANDIHNLGSHSRSGVPQRKGKRNSREVPPRKVRLFSKSQPLYPCTARLIPFSCSFVNAHAHGSFCDRNLHVPSARSMLVATIRWRDIFDIDKAVKDEYPKEVFGGLGHVYGKDNGGRPVT